MEPSNEKLAALLDKAGSLYRRGAADEAAAALWANLTDRSDHLPGWLALADLERELGRRDKVAEAVRKACGAAHDDPKVLFDLASKLRAVGDNEGAAGLLIKVAAALPQSAAVWSNLGNAQTDLGRYDEAELSYGKALGLKPCFIDALVNLGLLYVTLGRLRDAGETFSTALDVDGTHPTVLLNLGGLALQAGQNDVALERFSAALEADPGNRAALYNKGCVLGQLGRFDEAVAAFQCVLTSAPDDQDAQGQLFHILQKTCAWEALGKAEKRLEEMTVQALAQKGRPGETPFMSIARSADPERNFEVARAWAAEMETRLAPLKRDFVFPSAKEHEGPLKIGYLSGNFYDHPTAYNTAGLFSAHDRSRFKVHAYSFGPDDGSAVRRQIERDCDVFTDLSNRGDGEAAARINEDGIDILIALTGHTDGSRLEICALKPAPLQVGYLTFPGTSGGDFLDYILVDQRVCPKNDAQFFSETPAYLPDSYWPTDNRLARVVARPSRASQGLPKEGVVFSCFNQTYKIDPTVFGVWMALLKKTPGSVLWLFGSNPVAVGNLKNAAEASGVEAGRLVFADKLPKADHLARMSLADLMLDTRTYTGHTTTADALWAGVPVIALEGSHFASSVSASLLAAHGMDDLIVPDLAAYEDLAFQLASDPARLNAVRRRVEANKETYPLFDTQKKVRALETLYEAMWQRHREGLSPCPLPEGVF